MSNSFITFNKKHKQRLILVLLLLIGVGIATALTVRAFQENMMYHFKITEITEGKAPLNRPIRVGGLVTTGSLQRATDSLKVRFNITDTKNNLAVNYEGILPDLFREGQGVVAIGKLQENGQFVAEEILAKHDETYMPPEAAASLQAIQKEQAKVKP